MMSDDDRVAYETMSARRMHHDVLVWQVPVLSMTAQSFLFSIALGAGTTQVARTIACGLAFTVAAMSIVMMIRHRAFERSEAEWIDAIELSHGLRVQREITPTYDGPRGLGWLVNVTAYGVWLFGLLLFGIAAIVTLAVTWLPYQWLR